MRVAKVSVLAFLVLCGRLEAQTAMATSLAHLGVFTYTLPAGETLKRVTVSWPNQHPPGYVLLRVFAGQAFRDFSYQYFGQACGFSASRPFDAGVLFADPNGLPGITQIQVTAYYTGGELPCPQTQQPVALVFSAP